MKPIEKFPYDDNNMRFDEKLNRYVLTEKALLDLGIDLRARLAARKAVSPELLISNKLNSVSRRVYGFIHKHNVNNHWQDHVLAFAPSARNIIYEALIAQAEYELSVGNLNLSADESKIKLTICNEVPDILSQPICEIGRSILYTGVC